MHGKSGIERIQGRKSIGTVAILVLTGVSGYFLADRADYEGIPRKWITALFATLIPFAFVLHSFRERFFRWSFWTAFCFCLSIHLLAICSLLQYVRSNIRTISRILCYPVMLFEIFVLLIAIKRADQALANERYPIGLKF